MITIKKSTVEAIYKQGDKEAPLEACGYLAGQDEELIKRYPMYNVDQSSDHFTLDPAEQFKVIKEARNEGLEVNAVYHTHPETPARPSEEDIRLAFDPNIIYIIASLVGEEHTIKAFRIKDKEVTVLEMEVIE